MSKLKLVRLVTSSVVVFSMLALNPIGTNAEWKQDSTGWWYKENNSWATGWKQVDNYWRYFYSNGEMAHDAVIDGYVINTWGIWAEGITPNEVEYFKKLASGEICDIDSSAKIVFDGCYTKEDSTYGKTFKSMDIKDNTVYMYEIVPVNGEIQSEPTKIIIGKYSRNVYMATGGLDLSQWKNKQKIKVFKYID